LEQLEKDEQQEKLKRTNAELVDLPAKLYSKKTVNGKKNSFFFTK